MSCSQIQLRMCHPFPMILYMCVFGNRGARREDGVLRINTRNTLCSNYGCYTYLIFKSTVNYM